MAGEMRLHEHTDFAAFTTASAAEHDLSEPFVEKDCWITEILRVRRRSVTKHRKP